MLDNKLCKLTSMMSTQGSNENRPFCHRFIKEEREDKVDLIIMIEVANRIGLDY